jgi:hypothetical protein
LRTRSDLERWSDGTLKHLRLRTLAPHSKVEKN